MSNKSLKFKPHKIIWDIKKISRVWDYYSSSDNDYFSKTAGNSIIKFVKKKIPLQGKVLDFGCGTGLLIEKLLKMKIYTGGFDLSDSSLDVVKNRLGANPFFLGAFYSSTFSSPMEENYFDVVFFIETIEHLLPEQMDFVLSELYRIIKKEGYLVVTSPNMEDLKKRKVICPECGCIFHRKQHISSFSTSSMNASMKKAGFSTVFCKPVLFSVSRITWLRRFFVKLTREIMPNLLYIGIKE